MTNSAFNTSLIVEGIVAKLDAHQANDKKRQNGNFRPQGKKGAKKAPSKSTGHKNKYEQFSQAADALARHERQKAAETARKERELREARMGWGRKPYLW